jgi:type IV pilus assembly protein PilB
MVEATAASKKGIADILRERSLLTAEQVADLKTEQITAARPIEEIIAERKLVDPRALAEAKAQFLNVSYFDVSDVDVPPEILNLVPQTIAARHALLPVKKDGESLVVVMADPLDLQVIEFLERKTGLKVAPYLAETEAIKKAVDAQYQKTLGEEVSEALEEVGVKALKLGEAKDIEREPEVISKSHVADIVESVLQYAARSKASDVHIEPIEGKTRVRYRIDGVLHERLTLPLELQPSIVSRIKVLSNLRIEEKRVPQDGRFKIEFGGREIDLRVSTMPTSLGEKVAIRLLEETEQIPPFSDLGMRGVALKRMEESLRRPNGIIYITGPTGSGKTLTLASSLSKINTPKINIITLEDPVEVEIPGVNQTQINPAAGLTFATGLRSILRQDPDVIMVGETRDNETAELSIHAALTGHLVFSTLHTNSAAGALPRLIDMKTEPFLLTSTVIAVEAQRLVRKVCSECKKEYPASTEEQKQIKELLGSFYDQAPKKVKKGKLMLTKGGAKGKKCEKCGGSGYSGRTGIFEVLMMSDTISRLVLEQRPTNEIQDQAVKEGMITLVQDGLAKVLEGVTTTEEVLRVAEE